MNQPKPSYALPYTLRLHGNRAFTLVFDGKMRKNFGPILFWAIPNSLGHPRMGLSVSRRVGNAVRRNRIKRLLREAYRFTQHDWPTGYDLVIVVRPHTPLELASYLDIFKQAIPQIHAQWEKRRKNPPPLTP